MGLGVDHVLGVRLEVERPQHQGQTRRRDVAGRRRVGIEHRADAGAHRRQARRQDDQAAKQRPQRPRGREPIVPGHAPRPGMADRRDEDEAAHEFGRVQRHGEAERAGQRMDDDDRPRDAEARQSFAQHLGLPFGRGGGARGRARAPAVSRPIDAENAKAERGETIGEREAHVGEIAGGAVDEQNGAAFGAVRRALDDVDRAGVDWDEFADRRKTPFDAPRLNHREEDEASDQGDEGRDSPDHDRAAGSGGALTALDPRGRP